MQASTSTLSSPGSRVRSDILGLVRRRPLLIAYLLALAPAAVMALTQPVWSLVDEAQHFDFIVQLGHGVYPVVDTTLISAETRSISGKTGVYRAFYPPGSYPTPDLTDVGPPPAGMTDSANALWMQRHMWQLSREAIQTPGYYLVMVPVWWVADVLGGPFAALYALRLVNALLAAALAPIGIAMARLIMPGRADVQTIAAVFAILLPGVALNLVRVSNDTLAAVLGGLALLLAARWAANQWSWRRVAIVGLLLGGGMLVKLTTAGLFPAIALAMLWPAPSQTARAGILRVVVAGVIALLCLVPWFLIDLHTYGSLTSGARGARVSDAVPHGLTADFIPQDVGVFLLTYWSGEPWGALPLSGGFAVLGVLVALMAPVGIVKALRAKSDALSRGPLAVAIAAVASMTFLTLALPATLGFEFLGPGRYAYPAAPAVAALCAIGVVTVLTGTGRRAVAAVYGAIAVAMLIAAAVGWLAAPQPGSGAPPSEARVVQVEASGSSQGMTITVDRVALDANGRATWFHVTAANSGSDELEWTVPGDYLGSTHLPGDVDPGESVSGWLYVPAAPSELHFTGITPVTYQAIGAVDLAVHVT